ncbi:DUF2905 domain-containing protein [Desulfogranum japonicum]|uniref:DUF2905 domain-containing protein n=1 Tax=Desulfogranum japonicum TaxID=231447 RepID=UPI0004149AF4|nr:DUF2905 domain-containing protein [Desulfogranum japonicum]
MNKTLVLVGALIIIAGLCWPWIRQIPFGKLPGDITVVRENFRFYFPVTSCVVISILATLLFHLFRK